MLETILFGFGVFLAAILIIIILCALGELFFNDPNLRLAIPFIIILWLGIFYLIGAVIQGLMK